MDIYRALPEGTRAEIIDNIIYMARRPLNRIRKFLLHWHRNYTSI